MSSDSSSEEEDVPQFTKNATADFFKTLTALKNKDPSIYQKDSKFYHSDDEEKPKVKKEKSMTLKDYDRKKITEKGGIIDEAAEDVNFAKEQADIKEEIRKAGAEVGSDSDSDDELFTKKPVEKTEDKSESDVEEPKAVDSKEKFIFDYLMNQKWQAVDQEEDYSSGEELSDKKYRKADADFIRPLVEKEEAVKSEPVDAVAELSGQKSFEPKSYPRNPDELASMRQDAKAEARAKKRAEKKAKKELKLAQRKEETARKRNEKVENLKTKLDQLREAVGNDIELDENMFDGDFDPEMHERLMAKIEENAQFDDDEKPVFDEMDFTGFDFSDDEYTKAQKKAKKERKRGKRAKKGEIDDDRIDEAKKHFPDAVKEIEDLDYEVDYVGDTELKFKYRETEAQNYGLTIEELLNATDQELNTWVSLKQVTKYQSPEEIRGDKFYWAKQAKNEKRKKQVFKSIYGTEEEKERIAEAQANKKAKKMNSKRRRKLRERMLLQAAQEGNAEESAETKNENEIENEASESVKVEKAEEPTISKKAKKRKKKQKATVVTEDRLEQYFGADTKNVIKRMKYGDTSLKHEV